MYRISKKRNPSKLTLSHNSYLVQQLVVLLLQTLPVPLPFATLELKIITLQAFAI